MRSNTATRGDPAPGRGDQPPGRGVPELTPSSAARATRAAGAIDVAGAGPKLLPSIGDAPDPSNRRGGADHRPLLAASAAPAQASIPARVAALQSALKELHLYSGFVDGIRGPLTRHGIVAFQRRRGLHVDGIAGPRTRRALGWRGRPGLGSRVMRSGDRGWDVAALQFLLQRAGHGPGRADGVFGPLTRAAVLRAQEAAGIAVDGLAGPQTIRALRIGGGGDNGEGAPSGPVRFLRPVPGPIGVAVRRPAQRLHPHRASTSRSPTAPRSAPPASGRSIYAAYNGGGYGNLVVIQHRLGYTSWYGHMSRIAAYVGEQRRRRHPDRVRRRDRRRDRPPPPLRGPPLRHADQPGAAAALGGRLERAPAGREACRQRSASASPRPTRRPPPGSDWIAARTPLSVSAEAGLDWPDGQSPCPRIGAVSREITTATAAGERVRDRLAGRKLLLTGASGFLGKAVLATLLRSAPDIDQIVVLLQGARTARPRAERLDGRPRDRLLRRAARRRRSGPGSSRAGSGPCAETSRSTASARSRPRPWPGSTP